MQDSMEEFYSFSDTEETTWDIETSDIDEIFNPVTIVNYTHAVIYYAITNHFLISTV